MVFAGLKKETDRADLIAYLEQQSKWHASLLDLRLQTTHSEFLSSVHKLCLTARESSFVIIISLIAISVLLVIFTAVLRTHVSYVLADVLCLQLACYC